MSLTQQFFAEGEIQEARAWKNSPLLFDETTEPEATKYTSFDRVPRRWTPIIIAILLVGMAGAGGAWAMGLWQPPPGVVSWASRFDPRVIFTPTAPSAAAMVSATPAVQSADAPRVEAAAPSPTEVAAPAPTEVTAPAPTTIAPSAPAAPPEAASLGAATAALAATADAPVARSQSPADSEPAEATAAPVPVVVPLPARSAASTADDARATTAEPARLRPIRHERVTPASKARHGYVWSDQRGNLVPATPVTAGTTSGAPDDTLPVSAEVSGNRAGQGSSSARAWDSERADGEQPAPPQPPRQHPPTSSASATEPRPIPVPAIEAPKKLPEPTEMAAPSGP